MLSFVCWVVPFILCGAPPVYLIAPPYGFLIYTIFTYQKKKKKTNYIQLFQKKKICITIYKYMMFNGHYNNTVTTISNGQKREHINFMPLILRFTSTSSLAPLVFTSVGLRYSKPTPLSLFHIKNERK
jgi:hypothetical protein